jgi:hypothetical protein
MYYKLYTQVQCPNDEIDQRSSFSMQLENGLQSTIKLLKTSNQPPLQSPM